LNHSLRRDYPEIRDVGYALREFPLRNS
jgi:hypothetical protein